jgi:hypothetical protein
MAGDASIEEKEKVISILERLLNAEGQLGFLLQLSLPDLQTLIVAIRGRMG